MNSIKAVLGGVRLFVLYVLFIAGKFEQVARLTVEGVADGVERFKAYALHLARFEDGKIDVSHAYPVRQFAQGYLAVCHHLVEPYDNCHDTDPLCAIESLCCGSFARAYLLIARYSAADKADRLPQRYHERCPAEYADDDRIGEGAFFQFG